MAETSEITKMNQFESSLNGMVRYMYYLAGLAIVLMMVITTTDVFLRFCVTLYATFKWSFLEHWRPIPGTYDLVGLCGSLAAAFAMAHTTLESGHVAVRLIVRRLEPKTQTILKFVTDALSGLLFGVLAWRCVLYAIQLKESGEVSMTMQLPFHPFVYLLGFSALAVTLVFLTEIIKDINKVLGK